ncbi:hypothetical protein EVAR_33247_1 [Eumeta japonica]|uniref:Uncharacterized protein n=1 Tax=Eumeta variegata TaxID=151549 RepID=A0A4C1WYI4_EUMVA|nr:hypothetical protein EVAR_33247_1 [Eumeta japonica]
MGGRSLQLWWCKGDFCTAAYARNSDFLYNNLGEWIYFSDAGKMMDSVDVQTSLLQHELHMWRPEYNCDECLFFFSPLATRRRLKMSILHTLAPVRLEVYSASPCAAGQHARVLTARDLPCGGSLMGTLSAHEVTGTPTRVGPIRYLDAGAV